jgi:hypothetical protein
VARDEDAPVEEAFLDLAESFEEGGSPLYARLAREVAADPLVAEIAGDHRPRWETPMRLFAGVHLLELTGEEPDPWPRFRDVLEERRDWLTRFVAEQQVQTNEVQRAWALAPAFLEAAGSGRRTLDLVELGPSAGLNLLWDRFRYRYGDLVWGPKDAPLELAGEAEGGPPPQLLERRPVVRGRCGIDRRPVDVRDDEQALRLQSFVWADQEQRLERLRRAIAAARAEPDPPRLLAGNYLDVLPDVLAARREDALTVVFHSASVSYLRTDERRQLTELLADAARTGPLARIAYEFVETGGEPEAAFGAFALDLTTWPGGETRRLARLDGHANRMRWLA